MPERESNTSFNRSETSGSNWYTRQTISLCSAAIPSTRLWWRHIWATRPYYSLTRLGVRANSIYWLWWYSSLCTYSDVLYLKCIRFLIFIRLDSCRRKELASTVIAVTLSRFVECMSYRSQNKARSLYTNKYTAVQQICSVEISVTCSVTRSYHKATIRWSMHTVMSWAIARGDETMASSDDKITRSDGTKAWGVDTMSMNQSNV